MKKKAKKKKQNNNNKKKKTQEADDIPQKLTDADDADDQALLAHIPAQTEFLLHSLQQVAEDIDL